MVTYSERREVLERTAIFGSAGERVLDDLANATRVRELAPGEVLFERGDIGRNVYVVMQGCLRVCTSNGLVLRLQTPGDLVGEMALFLGSTRTATIDAREPTTVLAIDRRDFFETMRRHPDAYPPLIGLLATRLDDLTQFVDATLHTNLPNRLARLIEGLVDRSSTPTEDGFLIDLELSQNEWGRLVGATREAVNKAFKEWRSEGVIRMDGLQLVVLDLDRIRELAADILAGRAR